MSIEQYIKDRIIYLEDRIKRTDPNSFDYRITLRICIDELQAVLSKIDELKTSL